MRKKPTLPAFTDRMETVLKGQELKVARWGQGYVEKKKGNDKRIEDSRRFLLSDWPTSDTAARIEILHRLSFKSSFGRGHTAEGAASMNIDM